MVQKRCRAHNDKNIFLNLRDLQESSRAIAIIRKKNLIKVVDHGRSRAPAKDTNDVVGKV